MRVVIAGGPRTGKSTLFRKLSLHFDCAVGTDDYMGLEWSAVPDAVIGVLEKHEDWIVEGVQAARVLRRWARDRKNMPHIDVVYYLTEPMAQQTNAHRAMAKSIATVWKDVAPRLIADGTRIVREVERGD
jgi:hypothetical protein